jgi:26S proteasome regulatory subunit N1
MKRQLAFILACARVPLEWLQPPSVGDAEIATDEELSDNLLECLYNTKLSTHFRDFGKKLGVADARVSRIFINRI